ncbi:MAG: hypothetical protein MUF45_11635 [Spirosomaceae bacterium]|jgi:hypothetical protein|nr:hypothetical protein [Spirosomataceae bacterium]
MKTKLSLIVLLAIIFGCEGVNIEADNIGSIEGKVTIGPLCPVVSVNTAGNPCGYSDAQMNAIYGAYKVVVTAANQATKKESTLDKSGVFKFDIPEGSYEVAVQKVDGSVIGVSGQKSTEVLTTKVVKSQVSRLEISIDTGIR